MKTCPSCGSTLNKLTGRDGQVAHPVGEVLPGGIVTGRIVLKVVLDTIWTCPKCEHCE